MTQQKVPAQLRGELPYLPLYNQVLLPGAITRVSFDRSHPVRYIVTTYLQVKITRSAGPPHTDPSYACSEPLIEHILAQHGERVYVAAVPLHDDSPSRQVKVLHSPEDADAAKPKEIATAARVQQVSRITQVHHITCLVPALANPIALADFLCRLVHGL